MSDLINAITQLTAALNAPVVPIKDADGKIVGAKREVPPVPTASEMEAHWDRLEKLAREGKVNTTVVFALVRGLARGIEARKQAIELLEASLVALQKEVRELRNG